MQQVLDGAALGARLCGLGDCPLRGRVCLERRGHLLRVAVLGLVDLARLDGLLKLGEGLLKLLAVGRSAVLAQHTLAEERHLGGGEGYGLIDSAYGARAVRVRCACGGACGGRAVLRGTCSSSSPVALDIVSPDMTFLIHSSAAVFCLLSAESRVRHRSRQSTAIHGNPWQSTAPPEQEGPASHAAGRPRLRLRRRSGVPQVPRVHGAALLRAEECRRAAQLRGGLLDGGGAQRDVKVDCRYRMLRRHVSAASQCGARVEAGAEGCDGAESRVLEARGAGRG